MGRVVRRDAQGRGFDVNGTLVEQSSDQRQDTADRELQREIARDQAEAARVARNKELGLDARGLPLPPEFQGITGEGGKLDEGFGIGEFDAVNVDTDLLQRFKEQSLQEGPTQAGQRLLDLQGLQEQGQFDQGRLAEAGALAQAQNALASQGGLSGGARERLGRGALREALLGRQQIRGAGALERSQISAEDEARKNQFAQQAQSGFFQQGQFDQGNRQFEAQRRQFDISTRLDELKNRREQEAKIFEAEKSAQAAEASARASRGSSCFAPGTLIPMADGSYKKVEEIKVGDAIMVGGTVTSTIQQAVRPEMMIYTYEGILVAGNHAVKEDNRWIRVFDSKKAELYKGDVEMLYNFSNENHLIPVHGTLFADYEEHDEIWLSEYELLDKLNEQLSKNIECIDEEQPRQ